MEAATTNRYLPEMSNPDPAIIDDPQNLTPAWLTQVLQSAGYDARVRSCRSESVGTGQMAHNERIFLDYEGDAGSAPATIVGKFPSPRPESRRSPLLHRTRGAALDSRPEVLLRRAVRGWFEFHPAPRGHGARRPG
jgi:hypothetical protein